MKKRLFENFHWSLSWVTAAILIVGLVNLYSALEFWGTPGGSGVAKLFWSQCIWIGIGLGMVLLMVAIDYRLWERLGWTVYGILLCALVATVIFGREVNGNRSWLSIGSLTVQPSEFAKLACIFVLAKFFGENPRPEGYGLQELVRPMLMAGTPCLIILLQKDLGSALFFPLIFISISWAARLRRATVLVFFVLITFVSILGYQYALSPYQKARILTFVNPTEDVRGTGYHLMQSKIAVGSGEMFGKGYLKGKINKLHYLPEQHTDFIFPVLAEEWGFLGSLLVLSLFGTFLWMSLRVAIRARERFGSFLAYGIVAWFFWQIVINLGGVLGILPLTGVTLPFLSYGGSSMVALLMSVGLLLNIHMRRFMF